MARKHWDTFLLLWLGILLFWGESWEAQFSMDAMTYAGLARRILLTGDWKILHYSTQYYADFYQHPPLAMWLMALFFKLTGQITEVTAKVLPYLFSVGTLLLTMRWGRRATGTRWGGFLAGLILLTSTRYIKYAASPMLDGFLAFWMVLGGALLLEAILGTLSPLIWGTLLGLCVSLGFLTKGMPILALVAEMLGVWAFILFREKEAKIRKRANLGFAFASMTTVAVLALWLGLGEGQNYLHNYWEGSVRARMGGQGPAALIVPLRNLFKGYWPWIPVYLIGLGWQAKLLIGGKATRERVAQILATICSLAILGGYSWSGHFLEHYLVPFFPFAAIVGSSLIAHRTEKWMPGTLQVLTGLFFCITLLLATFPLHIQGEDYRDSQRILLRLAPHKCSGSLKRVYMLGSETPMDWGIAMGAWYTPWDPQVRELGDIPKDDADALLLSRRRSDLADWVPTELQDGEFRIYQRPGASFCPNALP